MIQSVLEQITAQQPKERTPVWVVGEQLKDILRAEPHLAELVAQDLTVADMSLVHCEKKIKAYADAHKTGSFACVTPEEAETIIRDFYGLNTEHAAAPLPSSGGLIHLEDFM